MAKKFANPKGRPRSRTCTHVLPKTHHGRCLRNARVRVITEMAGRHMVMYRCWEHYVTLEERSRESSTLNIIRASIMKGESRA